VTPAGFRAAAESLGTSYISPVSLTSSFGRGRFDGAAAARNLVFQENCTCYVYVGQPRAVP
jgi:hypothetical protein